MSPIVQEAIARFSAIGRLDPRRLDWNGEETHHQLAESACLLHYIRQLDAAAPDELIVAAHCQHLRRFAYSRSAFPAGRIGYLAWRKDAGRRSAAEAAEILRELGFTASFIERVERIITKQERQYHPEVQTMQDALALAFLRLEASTFAAKHESADAQRILARTWAKMSPRAKTLALREDRPESLRALLVAVAAISETTP